MTSTLETGTLTDLASSSVSDDMSPELAARIGYVGFGKGGRFSLRRLTEPYSVLPYVVLVGLAGMVQLEGTALGVLSPDIQKTFSLSAAGIGLLTSVGLVLSLVLDIPVGYLGDRVRRMRMASFGLLIFVVFSMMTGLAGVLGSLPLLYLLRMGASVGGGFISTQNSLAADYWPPNIRAKMYFAIQGATTALSVIGPALVGLISLWFHWEVPFLILSLPGLGFAYLGFRLFEPIRGFHERRMLGADDETATIEDDPPGFSETFRILLAQPTSRRVYFSLPFLTAGTIGLLSFVNLVWSHVYHLSASQRGFIGSALAPGGILGLLFGVTILGRIMARNPGAAMRLVAAVICGSGVLLLGFAFAPNVPVAAFFLFVNGAALALVLPGVYGVISLAVPPRMRTLGFATGSLWLLPGFIVLPLAGVVADKFGYRVGMAAFVPILAVGAFILQSAGGTLNADVDKVRVATLARAEARKLRNSGEAKLLLVRGLDAGYDGVQVLFGIDFEVGDGELVALLGTNGSGKSTLLKAVSGLLLPTGGAVLFDGDDITSADPRRIVQMGVSHMPGGRGIFPTLTVEENLRVAAWLYRKDPEYLKEANESVLGYFPILKDRWDTPAGSLSGGEQQMLSLAQAFLSRPRLLMIDELSLGLAPTIVERLLEIVRAIHANGSTIILVEQSVNIALRLAEKAFFLEKGEVRFSGPTSELLQRDDVLRAVYLHGTAKGLSDESAEDAAKAAAQAKRRVQELAQAPVVMDARGLTKRYGGVTAVQGVDLELHQGEVVGLMGPNGAGKTTLFDLLSGHTPSNGGSVRLLGEDVTSLAAFERARKGLGRSFQDARLFPGLTVAETIGLALADRIGAPGALHAMLNLYDVKYGEAAISKAVEEVIELLNLGPFRDKFTSELSTGSRRLVELAVMVAERPKVLMLDEPSAGIAQRETEALGPVLRQVQRHLDCSILIIEHDMPLMRSLADRLIAMDTGQVVVGGEPDTVLSDPRVVASYLGTATLEGLEEPNAPAVVETNGHAKPAAAKRATKAKTTTKAPARRTPAGSRS